MTYEHLEDTVECEGMCFDPSRVLTEIFTLEGAFNQTGMSLESIDKNFYLQEVARTISSIALQCRQQMTSYFYQVPNPTDATRNDRIEFIKSTYQSADEAIGAVTGNLICPKNGIKPVSFYDMIGKLCHVEKWVYPVQTNIEIFDEDKSYLEGLQLLIYVTKRGKDPVTGEIEKIIVSLPLFISAARVFITGCTECQLYRPMSDELLEEEPSCSAL